VNVPAMSSGWRQRGITLVEVMVALALGLLVSAGVFQVYLGNKRNADLQESLLQRQEAARFATMLLTRDLQMAGYRGCARDSDTTVNTLNTPDDFLFDFASPVEGFNARDGGWTPALPESLPDVATGSDVLTVRTIDDPGVVLAAAMTSASAPLEVLPGQDPAPFAVGDLLLVTDCGGSAIFQVTSYDPGAGLIGHAAAGGTPGNATSNLGRRFAEGAQLHRLRTTSYFIAPGSTGSGSALWRQVGRLPAEELAEGIENLQLQFGEDRDGDRVADRFGSADEVGSWNNVVAVRIGLLVASTAGRVTSDDPRTFDVLDEPAGPFADGRLRRVVRFDVALRNRVP